MNRTASVRRWTTVASVVVRDTVRRSRDFDLALIAAGLTLYAGIAVVPLLLFGLYGAGLLLGADRVAELVTQLSRFSPRAFGARDLLQTIGVVGPQLGVPALIASVVTASTYGEGVLRAFATIDERQDDEATERPSKTVRGRLLVIPYLAVFPLVTAAGLLVVSVLPRNLGSGLGGQLLGVYLTFWAGWLSASALLIVLYKVFSGVTLRWSATVWGALAAGSFMSGMSLGWVLLLRFGVTVGRAYGGSDQIGRVVLLAIYLLFVQVTLLLGYLLTRSIDRYLAGGTEHDANAT